MADYIGQQFGNYRLIRLLGRGGFAEVYLGEHVRLGMKAAIKILHTNLLGAEIDAFQSEAKTIADLTHPHIVRVLDFDVQNGLPFLVLDYAPSGSLREKHPRGIPVPLPLVIQYIEQVGSALHYAHEQRLIHRDIKPENMLVGRQGEILLSDFGIASVAHSTSSMSTQASMGTLVYMAPEQIQGKPRPASDQYALAVTIYQWLSGVFPFQGSSTEIIAQHLAVAPPPLRNKAPQVPVAVEQVVMTALAKEPRERFASVQAFATALAQASGTGQVRASIVSPLVPNALPNPGMPAGSPAAIASPPVPYQAGITPTTPASPVAFQPQPMMPAMVLTSPIPPRPSRRTLKPWLVAGLIEAALPLLLFLVQIAMMILGPRAPVSLFFDLKLAFFGDSDCGFLTKTINLVPQGFLGGDSAYQLPAGTFVCKSFYASDSSQNWQIVPPSPANMLHFIAPNFLPFLLPTLIVGVVAFFCSYFVVGRSKVIRGGVLTALYACLWFVGSTLVMNILLLIISGLIERLAFWKGPGVLLQGMLIYLVIVGLLAALLSVSFALLGGLFGKRRESRRPPTQANNAAALWVAES